MRYDVAIIGGGAAGLMCAIEAGKRGRRVVVLEHNAQIGRKILISGGGRCNFTNLHTRPEHFLSANPHFAKSALARYTPRDFHRRWWSGTAFRITRRRSGNSSATARRATSSDAAGGVRRGGSARSRPGARCAACRAGVRPRDDAGDVRGGVAGDRDGRALDSRRSARRRSATRSRGSSGSSVVPCRPALVPLTFAREDRERFGGSGGRLGGRGGHGAGRRRFREKLLFTHRGLSGPAVLQASSYWRGGEAVAIDLAPGIDVAAELRAARASGSKGEPRTIAARFLRSVWRTCGSTGSGSQAGGGALGSRDRGDGGEPARLAVASGGDGGIREGRGHGGRGGYGGVVVEDDGGAEAGGAVFHGRGGGCHGAFGRVQFSMGLGVGSGGGSGGVKARYRNLVRCRDGSFGSGELLAYGVEDYARSSPDYVHDRRFDVRAKVPSGRRVTQSDLVGMLRSAVTLTIIFRSTGGKRGSHRVVTGNRNGS